MKTLLSLPSQEFLTELLMEILPGGIYKWQIVEKGRQVLYCKFESTIPQDQVDDVKLILSSMLSIIALSSIKYIYIYRKRLS